MPRIVEAPLPRKLTCAVALLDIPPLRVALLLALHRRGGTATTRELRDDTGSKPVTTHRHLSELEKLGIVTRSTQPGPRNPPLVWTLNADAVRAELDTLRRAFD